MLRPLNGTRNFFHQRISARNCEERRVRRDGRLSFFIQSITRRRMVRPPCTTWQAKFNDPARDCSWRLDAEALAEKDVIREFRRPNLSDERRRDIVVESSSIPKKVARWHGETTFFQLTLNPSEWSSLIRASRPCWHSAFVLPTIDKKIV